MEKTLSIPQLNEEERCVLIELVNSALNQAHSEITCTERWDYKDLLKKRREVLEHILFILNQPTQTNPTIALARKPIVI